MEKNCPIHAKQFEEINHNRPIQKSMANNFFIFTCNFVKLDDMNKNEKSCRFLLHFCWNKGECKKRAPNIIKKYSGPKITRHSKQSPSLNSPDLKLRPFTLFCRLIC